MELLIKRNASVFLAIERDTFGFLTMTFTLLLQTPNCQLQPIADCRFYLFLIAVTIKSI
jgi:hypothetical protein